MFVSIACFEKVSNEQFSKDLKLLLDIEENLYDYIIIPKRATKGSAGYDFYSPIDFVLKPNDSIKIPTGIRCKINDEYVLQLYPRSSLGFKYQMCLLNTTGIIDSDYYYSDNQGHIIVAIINRGSKVLEIKKGDRFVQGIFLKYYLAQEDEVKHDRNGGFGSTD